MAKGKDDIGYNDALQLRGLAAEGVADRWRDFAMREMRERAAKLQPGVAQCWVNKKTPWIAGKYENLKRHEAREVRAGKIARLDAESEESALREASDIAAQSANDDDCYAKDLAAAAETRNYMKGLGKDGDKYYAGETARLGAERAQNAAVSLMQIGATSEMGSDRFASAVETGLFSAEEGAMRAQKYRRKVIGSVMDALIADGRADQAAAFADALERGGEDGGRDKRDSPGASRRAGRLAERFGVRPDEIAKWRLGIDKARRARAAAAERAAAEAESKELETIDLASREAIAGGTLEELDAAAAQMHLAAAGYAKGSRPRVAALEAAAKLDKAAAGLRAAEKKAAEDEKAAREKAETEKEKAKYDYHDALIVRRQADIAQLRATGDADDARRANDLESDLYFHVISMYNQNLIRPERFRDYVEKDRKQQLTRDECRAMAMFDSAIGLAAERDESGNLKTGSLKDLTDMGGWVELGRGKVDAAKVRKYHAMVLRELKENTDPKLNREEVMRRAVDKVSAAMFTDGEYEDMVREAKTAIESARYAVQAAGVDRRLAAAREADRKRTEKKGKEQ